MTFSTTDAGGGETYSNSTSFKADKISWSRTQGSSNHATGQDDVAMHRKTGTDWEVTVETKFYNSALHALLMTKELGTLVVTAPSGFSMTAVGLIIGPDGAYDKPSTIKFSLKAHGTDLAFA
jgi:hypothetical protein